MTTTHQHPQPNDHESNHELLTISEAAALLRTPVATLRYWRHLGIGPRSIKIGRRVLYRADNLHAWINEQRSHDGPSAA